MKIAIISPSMEHLHQLGAVVQQLSHVPRAIQGGKSRMREIAEQERPDMMFVEGMCCDPAELDYVEQVTSAFPNIAVILVCVNTTPEFLLNSMRAGVREVIPSPPSLESVRDAISRTAAKMQGNRVRQRGKVLAFVSCKGGSGATFIATNMASHLAESRSVLLIDLNLQFGDALSFVSDATPHATLADLAQEFDRLDASLLAGSTVKIAANFHVLAAPADPGQAMSIQPGHLEAILQLAAATYDYVILDVGRTIDALTVKALDHADLVFPVMQQAFPDVRNARKLLGVFKSLGYASDKVELIVNRFDRSADIGLGDIERSLGPVTAHVVSNSYKQVCASINQGAPVTQQARGSPVAKSLLELALSLSPARAPGSGFLTRLLKRA